MTLRIRVCIVRSSSDERERKKIWREEGRSMAMKKGAKKGAKKGGRKTAKRKTKKK